MIVNNACRLANNLRQNNAQSLLQILLCLLLNDSTRKGRKTPLEFQLPMRLCYQAIHLSFAHLLHTLAVEVHQGIILHM